MPVRHERCQVPCSPTMATDAPESLDVLLETNRDRLKRMIELRFDRRLQGRLDPSDIIQDAYVDAAQRWRKFAQQPGVPSYVWLRQLVGQRLIDQLRRHLGAQVRDVEREWIAFGNTVPYVSSHQLAAHFLGHLTTPSEAAMREERRCRLEEALGRMEPLDREILALRHFEQMTNGEAAAALSLNESAASKRHARALLRLKDILRQLPGGLDEL